MCKMISADLVIGNFIINSIINKNDLLKISQLVDYDNKLSQKITNQGYYTKFNINSLIDFQINYPFIIDRIDNENFSLKIHKDLNEDQLIRYFQMGVPNVILENMAATYQEIFK